MGVAAKPHVPEVAKAATGYATRPMGLHAPENANKRKRPGHMPAPWLPRGATAHAATRHAASPLGLRLGCTLVAMAATACCVGHRQAPMRPKVSMPVIR